MASRLRARLTFANVTSAVALFIALGGVSYAAINLPNNSVGSGEIKNNAVGSGEIKTNAVGSLEQQDGSVGAAEIADGSVGAAEVADGSVGAAEVADDSLTGADVAEGTLTGVPTPVTYRTANVFTGPGQVGGGVVTCPAGMAATGGGWDYVSGLAIIEMGFNNVPATSYYVLADNFDSSLSSQGVVQVACTPGTGAFAARAASARADAEAHLADLIAQREAEHRAR